MSTFRPAQPDSTGWSNLDWVEWLDRLGVLASVGPDETNACERCRGPVRLRQDGTPWPTCFHCRQQASATGPVVPISYSTSGRLTALIGRAKSSSDRQWLQIAFSSLLFTFLGNHLRCLEDIAGGPFHLATVIPSHPSKRQGHDHMKAMTEMFTGWHGIHWDDLLAKSDIADASTRRGVVDRDAFSVQRPVDGLRVLLVDDLYTSGGTTASAGATLVDAGAHPPLVVTLGRQITDDNDTSREFAHTNDLGARRYNPHTCAAHNDYPPWF